MMEQLLEHGVLGLLLAISLAGNIAQWRRANKVQDRHESEAKEQRKVIEQQGEVATALLNALKRTEK